MSAPITHFEQTGELSELEHEVPFFRQVESETDMRLRIIGRSSMGRPILSCEIGNPNGYAFVTVHQQHGGERMTRETAQSFVRNLAYTPSATEQEFLQNNSVVVIPNANPDGTPNRQRATATGVDMNRSWITLNQPESMAIKKELNRVNALTLVDSHEHNPQSPNQISHFFKADNELISTSHMDAVATHAEDWMVDHLDNNGISHEPFPSNPNAHQLTLRTHCIANHIYPMLVETIMRRGMNDRLDSALTFIHGALEYTRSNMTFIRNHLQNSISDSENGVSTMFVHSKNSSGGFGGIKEIEDPGSFVIPQDMEVPSGLLSDLGIEISGRTVNTRQKARKHLGTVLSPESYYYFADWPQPPVMPISGRGKVRIKGSPMKDLYLNLEPEFGV